MKKFISHSEKETENFAFELSGNTAWGTVLTLDGDLGAGKTVFARGFARGLGVTEPVSSPTYTIAQEYALDGGKRLYHLDLYRILDVNAALNFGVDEFLDDPNAFSLVEWPQRISGIIPPEAVRVHIRHLGPEQREISVQK